MSEGNDLSASNLPQSGPDPPDDFLSDTDPPERPHSDDFLSGEDSQHLIPEQTDNDAPPTLPTEPSSDSDSPPPEPTDADTELAPPNDDKDDTAEPAAKPEVESAPTESEVQSAKLPPVKIPADDVEAAFEELRRDGVLPSDGLSSSVLSMVGRRRVAAMRASDYDTAEALDSLALLIFADSRRPTTDGLSMLVLRYEELQKRYEDCAALWGQRIYQAKKEHAERAAALRAQHEQQVDEFKVRWQTPEYVKQFSHPSVKLLEMRHIEKKFALQRKWAEAKDAKRIADGQQKLEEAETKRALEGRMRAEFMKLRDRHVSEAQKLDEFYWQVRSELDIRKQKSLEALESAIRRLDSKIMSPRTKRFHVSKASDQSPSCTTPRTIRSLAEYRNGPPARLNIEPMSSDLVEQLTSFRRSKTATRTRSRRMPRF
jgi:hypothetical protein